MVGAILEAILAQIWHSTNFFETFRLTLASKGVTELSVFVNIADNMTAFKDAMSTFSTSRSCVWAGARILVSRALPIFGTSPRPIYLTQKSAARATIMEDFLLVHEIPVLDYNEKWKAFVDRHPEQLEE